MQEWEVASARVLATFIHDGLREPVLVLDGTGAPVLQNRAARSAPYSGVIASLSAASDERILEFLAKARRSGRARLDPPHPGLELGPVRLEAFAVEPWLVVVIHDVRERHALEEELRQLRRVEALGLLIASILHDFNNLMTPMLALSASLASELQASGSAIEIAADIESIAGRMASLFRDLVKMARPSPPTLELVGLSALVMGLRPLVQRVLGDRIELALSLRATTARIRVDRSRLEHALLNIVANARNAMPSGGRLEISTALEPEVAGADPLDATHVALVFRDNGQGMPEDVRTQAFDEFFTTREETGGTGLGLASVRRFVDEHGGTVELESALGAGTTVTIRLPRARSPQE